METIEEVKLDSTFFDKFDRNIKNGFIIDPSVFMSLSHFKFIEHIDTYRRAVYIPKSFFNFVSETNKIDSLVREFRYKKTLQIEEEVSINNTIKSIVNANKIKAYSYKDSKNEMIKKFALQSPDTFNSTKLMDNVTREIALDELSFLLDHSAILSANRIFLNKFDRFLNIPSIVLDYIGKFRAHKKQILNNIGINEERRNNLKWILARITDVDPYPPIGKLGAELVIIALDP